MNIQISDKQLALINASQRDIQSATDRAQLVLTSIIAGLQDLPEGAKLIRVTQDPPQLVFDVPEAASPASKPSSKKRGKRG